MLTLVTGGARSGKSAYAENLVLSSGLDPVYVATAAAHDQEMARRIEAHRKRRGAEWMLVEEEIDLPGVIGEQAAAGRILLIDCLTLWLSNMLLAEADIDERVARLCDALSEAQGDIVLVTNEVGMGIVPENALARRFRDLAGVLNQRMAALADRVVLVVSGIGVTVKP